MAKKTRNTLLLAGIQTVAGTPQALTGANAMLIRNPTLTPLNVETVARDVIRPYFGNSEQLAVTANGSVEFEVEIAGAGDAGTVPGYGPLLRGCAFSETVLADTSVTYQPVTNNIELVTLHVYMDGVFHRISDARGTVSFDITAKGIPVMKFKFEGAYNPIQDQVAPTVGVDFSTFKQPLAANKRNTPTWALHAYTGCLQSLTLDVANTLVWRSLIGCEGEEITDRKPAGKVVLELPAVAAFDWPNKVLDAITGPLTITHGRVSGNIVKFDAPAAQLTKPTYSDSDGIIMLNADLNIVPVAGNDEMTITVM
jgi:hypothetical protein